MYNFFKKKQHIVDTSKNQIHEYYSIKQKIQLPLKIKFFIEMLENYTEEVPDKKKIPKQISDIYKQFCKCFSKLPSQDKYYFLLAMAKIVQFILPQDKVQNTTVELQYQSKIDKVEATCQIRESFMGVSKWQDKIFKYLNSQKLVKICQNKNSKNQVIFQLNQYHIRASIKQKNTFVLESIFDRWKIQQKLQSFHIYFKDKALYNQIFNILRNTIIMTWKQRLFTMLNETQKVLNIESMDQDPSHGVRMLNTKTISNYFKTKQNIATKIMSKHMKFKIFSEVRKVKIYRSSKFENFYKTQNVVDFSYQQVIKNIELISRIPSKKLVHYEKMENFSKNISAVYYKYMVKGCTHQMLSIVDENIRQNQCKVIYKAIDNFTVEKNVQFIEIKVQRIGTGKTRISVFGFINFSENKKLNPISIIDFFLSIVQYQGNDEINQFSSSIKEVNSFQVDSAKLNDQCPDEQVQDQDDFHTVVGQNFDSDQERQLQMCNTFQSPKKNEQQECQSENQQEMVSIHERNVIQTFRNEKIELNLDELKKNQMFQTKNITITQNAFLKHRYYFEPGPSSNGKDLIKQHYFVGQWGKYQKGGVFSLNLKTLEKQKQVYRVLLTRLGKALMKRSLASISIPVIVLKAQSQLETIARNLTYAPLLFEKMEKQSALQKMKKTIILMVSMGTIGLSLSKPFNPILGQTYQAYIDNCPVYLEQIQHHPAVSTMFFIGRGYQIYGSVIPAISTRLNSVKCYSQSPIIIKFQNGDTIKFPPSKMMVGGLLVGDRTFDFCDTTFLTDEKNKIIAQITFGPKKRFGQHMKGDKTDFLWGYIYRVSQIFMEKFLKENCKLSPSSQKSTQILAHVYGCWQQKIYIDENVVFDFESQLPYKLVRQKYFLRSSSTLRNDINYLLQEDYAKSQDQKDRIQQTQREDARLRKKQQK